MAVCGAASAAPPFFLRKNPSFRPSASSCYTVRASSCYTVRASSIIPSAPLPVIPSRASSCHTVPRLFLSYRAERVYLVLFQRRAHGLTCGVCAGERSYYVISTKRLFLSYRPRLFCHTVRASSCYTVRASSCHTERSECISSFFNDGRTAQDDVRGVRAGERSYYVISTKRSAGRNLGFEIPHIRSE